MKKPMLNSKSFWAGITGIVAALAKMFGIEVPNEFFAILAAVSVIFVRMGVEQNKNPVSGKPY